MYISLIPVDFEFNNRSLAGPVGVNKLQQKCIMESMSCNDVHTSQYYMILNHCHHWHMFEKYTKNYNCYNHNYISIMGYDCTLVIIYKLLYSFWKSVHPKIDHAFQLHKFRVMCIQCKFCLFSHNLRPKSTNPHKYKCVPLASSKRHIPTSGEIADAVHSTSDSFSFFLMDSSYQE